MICRTQKQISQHSWLAVRLSSALCPKGRQLIFQLQSTPNYWMSDDKVLGSTGITPRWVFTTWSCHHGNPGCLTELMTKNLLHRLILKPVPWRHTYTNDPFKRVFSIQLHCCENSEWQSWIFHLKDHWKKYYQKWKTNLKSSKDF